MTEQQPQQPDDLITVAEWAAEEGVSTHAVYARIRKYEIPVTNGRISRAEANGIWRRVCNPIQQNKRSGRPPGGVPNMNSRQPVLAFKAPTTEGGRSLADIEIERAEVKLAKERMALVVAAGKVYPAEAIDQHIAGMITAARETFFHLPGELQDKLAACADPVECGRILQRAIDGALRKLAGFKA